jgi:hypothetical protein
MKFIIIIAATILGVCIAVGLAIGLPNIEIPECPEVRTHAEQQVELADVYEYGYSLGFEKGFNRGWYCSNHLEDEECLEWINRPE